MVQIDRLAHQILVSALLVFAIIVAYMPVSATAAVYKNLYTAEVLVAGQDAGERDRGMQQALKIVLSKASGVIQLPNSDELNSVLSNANKYVATFGYSESEEMLENKAGKEVPALTLRVTFDRSAVSRMLRQTSLPIWGENRPSLLVWLVQENSRGQRSIVSHSADTPLHEALVKGADQRGLPLILPFVDVEDQAILSDTELWGLFADPVSTASVRYNPGIILAGRYYRSATNKYEGRWMLIFKGQRLNLDVRADSEASFVQQGIDLAATTLAERYALRTGEANEQPAKLIVDNVRSAGDYAAVIDYLESLTAVRSAKPIQVAGAELTVHLTIDGSLQRFQEAMTLSGQLQPKLELNALEPQGSRTLHYQLQGLR